MVLNASCRKNYIFSRICLETYGLEQHLAERSDMYMVAKSEVVGRKVIFVVVEGTEQNCAKGAW